MKLRIPYLSAVAVGLAMTAAVPSGAQAFVEAGGLECRSPGSVAFIVGAVINFECQFRPSIGGPPHRYFATIRRVGVDLGFTRDITLGWVVFAPTDVIRPGDLAGNYGGVQAGASFGVGLGGNALVGGSNNSFALQPLSGQAQAGLNVAAGFEGLELRSAEPPPYVPHYTSHHRIHHHHRH